MKERNFYEWRIRFENLCPYAFYGKDEVEGFPQSSQ